MTTIEKAKKLMLLKDNMQNAINELYSYSHKILKECGNGTTYTSASIAQEEAIRELKDTFFKESLK